MFEQQLRRVSKYHGRRVLFIVILFFVLLSKINFSSHPHAQVHYRVSLRTECLHVTWTLYTQTSRAVCSSVREGEDMNNDIVGIVKFLKRGKKPYNNIQQTTRVVHAPTETYHAESKKKHVHSLSYNIMRKGRRKDIYFSVVFDVKQTNRQTAYDERRQLLRQCAETDGGCRYNLGVSNNNR